MISSFIDDKSSIEQRVFLPLKQFRRFLTKSNFLFEFYLKFRFFQNISFDSIRIYLLEKKRCQNIC